MPKKRERILKFPIPLHQVKCCKELPEQFTLPPNIHNIGPGVYHTHHYPTNEKFMCYHNRHKDCMHPHPHPFPNYCSTNFMSTINLNEYNTSKIINLRKNLSNTCKDPKCHVPNCKGNHPSRATLHNYKKNYHNNGHNHNHSGHNHSGHNHSGHNHQTHNIVRNTVNNKNPTHDWVKKSKQKRTEMQNDKFEDWGTIDHEDFDFDLKNDPYLDLIPEWRKKKLSEKKNSAGHADDFAVFNNNKNMKINKN